MKKLIMFFIFIISITSLAYGQQTSNNINVLLSSQGKIMYGDEPNSIVVIDYPQNIQRISDYLDIIDVAPQQVLIEARVVEVKLQKEHSLGVNWSLFGDKGSGEIGQFKVGSGNLGTAPGPLIQNIPYKTTYYPPFATDTTAAENPFTISIFDDNINVVLKTLASSLDTNILSAPRITTVNNRKAEMKIIESYPWAEPEASTDQNGNVTVTWKINYEEIGIVLKVEPTINNDGMISMVLEPEVSEKTGDLELTTSGVTYKVPIIDKRSASTKVVIGDGQTLIIGGLIKDKTTKGSTKVPLLGDIPGLGYLFKSKKDTTDKTELLIFVSPTIITPNEFVRMARREKYGIGKSYLEDREKEEGMLSALEKKEKDKQSRLASDLEALIKRQKSLAEESKGLEEAVLKEEKDLKALEADRDSIIKKRKGLIK